jgi:hypothetical protein
MHIVIHVHRDAHLFQIVATLHSPRRLAGRLHRWQEQRDQNADNGNDDQQLNQRERPPGKDRLWHGQFLIADNEFKPRIPSDPPKSKVGPG